MTYPQWIVLHVPHDSTEVPSSVREQFVLDDAKLRAELGKMTDHHTLALFSDATLDAQVVRAPVSRLVVDVERFPEDDDEPMSKRGMGAVYTATSELSPLRRALSAQEREELMRDYYIPHHARLETAVAAAVEEYGKCLVIDCHSFPNTPLPYELAAADSTRPDICIGTDEYHTSSGLAKSFADKFRRAGWSVNSNDPFSGALVPISRYRRDQRVSAIMVEINRKLYARESSAERLPCFDHVAWQIKQCCLAAVEAFDAMQS